MKQVKWSDGMHNRGRTPSLLVARGSEVEPFRGHSIDGMVTVTESKYTKSGKWSNTDYELAVAQGTSVVQVLEPFEYWGNTWADLARGITVLVDAHPGRTREEWARLLLPKFKEGGQIYNAVNRAIENKKALASLTR